MYAMKDFKYWLFTVIILLFNCPSINATNIVTYVVSDSIECASEKLKRYLSPHDTPTVDMTKAPEKGAFAYSLSCLV